MVNRVTLIGRLTRDPEVVPTSKGGILVNLRLATNSVHRDPDGNKVETTEYHSAVAFDRLAEVCQDYLRKGRLIYAEGRLRTRSWDDKEGKRHFSTEVVLDQMHILSPRQSAEEGAAQPSEIAEPEDVGEATGRRSRREQSVA
ncbi:MAG: single-stranded DNA-binding protein [Candidatus Dormibacteria bacterium]